MSFETLSERRWQEDYVFYDNIGAGWDNVYWKQYGAHSQGLKEKSMSALANRYPDSPANHILALARNELNKEKQVLADFFGMNINEVDWDFNNPANFGKYVRAVNETMQLTNMWKRTAQIVNGMIDVQAGLATNIEALFSNHLFHFITEEFSDYVNKGGIEMPDEVAFRQMVDNALDKALDRTLRTKSSKDPKADKPLEFLISVINKTDGFRQQFRDEMFSRYGFDKIKEDFFAQIQQDIYKKDGTIDKRYKGATKIRHNFKKTDFGKKFTDVRQMAVLGGYVVEKLSAVLNSEALITKN